MCICEYVKQVVYKKHIIKVVQVIGLRYKLFNLKWTFTVNGLKNYMNESSGSLLLWGMTCNIQLFNKWLYLLKFWISELFSLKEFSDQKTLLSGSLKY